MNVEVQSGGATIGVRQNDVWIIGQATDVLLSRFQRFQTVVASCVAVGLIPSELAGDHGTLSKYGLSETCLMN